ncbi:hypothetical protein U14_03727 [Candidatus Moduliflexus flocculans]|uniref:NAD(P)-binding domain-containing protein n=1 Tax=Candidatus Moduliflexus flocculans TaxID=1499966 RepID=A0A081BQ10_9BACT|nr:hypothetical protein U14_03727 [Candidatus Moduliflexus flocculans]
MKTFVVGASGATGRLLVAQLLKRDLHVKIIARTIESLPDHVRHHANLSIIQESILNLSDAEMAQHVNDCVAVASCLGHNLNFKGIFGQPRQLVTDATRRLCIAIKANYPAQSVKFVLMNTTGNRNLDLAEPMIFAERCVMRLIRLLLPPHGDNEDAANYLRTEIGQNDTTIEWVVVRPDTLINDSEVTPYEIYPSPIRSAIFNAGKTSRVNVAHFMAELITDHHTWNRWKGQMPVIYNTSPSTENRQ